MIGRYPGALRPSHPSRDVTLDIPPGGRGWDTAALRADNTMQDRWMTYQDAAVALRMTPESIRARARREHWRKQLGNDGKALILVPVDAEGIPPSDDDGDTPASRPVKRPEPDPVISNLLKIVKIMETFAFRFCTLWVTSRRRRQVQATWMME